MVVWDAHALVGEAARRVIMLIHADGTGLAETAFGRGHRRVERRRSKDALHAVVNVTEEVVRV
jgi:hypothetical protein